MRTESFREFECVAPSISDLDMVAGQFQERCASVGRVPIVIDDEYFEPCACRRTAGHGTLRGRADLSRGRGCTDGQPHDELAAPAGAVTASFHTAAVQRHETAHERQSDAEPALGSSQDIFRLRKYRK